MALLESSGINEDTFISIMTSPGWPELVKHLDAHIQANYKKTGKRQRSDKGMSSFEFGQELGFYRGIIYAYETLIHDLESTKNRKQEAITNGSRRI